MWCSVNPGVREPELDELPEEAKQPGLSGAPARRMVVVGGGVAGAGRLTAPLNGVVRSSFWSASSGSVVVLSLLAGAEAGSVGRWTGWRNGCRLPASTSGR